MSGIKETCKAVGVGAPSWVGGDAALEASGDRREVTQVGGQGGPAGPGVGAGPRAVVMADVKVRGGRQTDSSRRR